MSRSARTFIQRHRALADLLRRSYDPIGANGLPSDEYDGYVPAVARLIRGGATDEAVARHLVEVEQTAMGLRARPAERLIPLARRARAILTEPTLLERLQLNKGLRLELALGAMLTEAGVWDSARSTDGLGVVRVVTASPWRAVVVGQLWTMTQDLRLFCLELTPVTSRVPSMWREGRGGAYPR